MCSTFGNNGYWSNRRLQVIMDKLDEIYLCEENTMAYMALKDFHSFKRTAGGR